MSTKRFSGRRVVVTGASRGIGAATAQRFTTEGADVRREPADPSRTIDVLGRIEAKLDRE